MAEVVCIQDRALIEAIQRQNFVDQSNPQDYTVERGLFAEYSNGVVIDTEGGYNFILTGPGSKSLVETIGEKVKSGGKARLLDVGCGTGRFLTDCASYSDWSGLISCHGLTACLYNRIFRKVPFETTQEAIKRLGIEVKLGDAQKLASYYSPDQFDIVTAVKVSLYLADPWTLVKGIDYILKPGGVGYINYFFPILGRNNNTRLGLSNEELSALYTFFYKDKRFEIKCINDLVYKKTQAPLDIPIGYAAPILETGDFPSRISYRFLI